MSHFLKLDLPSTCANIGQFILQSFAHIFSLLIYSTTSHINFLCFVSLLLAARCSRRLKGGLLLQHRALLFEQQDMLSNTLCLFSLPYIFNGKRSSLFTILESFRINLSTESTQFYLLNIIVVVSIIFIVTFRVFLSDLFYKKCS